MLFQNQATKTKMKLNFSLIFCCAQPWKSPYVNIYIQIYVFVCMRNFVWLCVHCSESLNTVMYPGERSELESFVSPFLGTSFISEMWICLFAIIKGWFECYFLYFYFIALHCLSGNSLAKRQHFHVLDKYLYWAAKTLCKQTIPDVV